MANIFDPGENGLVAQIFKSLNEILEAAAVTMADKLSTPSQNLFLSFIGLVVFFYIYQVVSTRAYDVKSLIEVIIRISIFWVLITSGAWLARFVLPIMFQIPAELGKFLTEGLGLEEGNPILALSDLASLVWTNVKSAIEKIEGNMIEKVGKQILIGVVGIMALVTVGLMIIASFVYIGGGQIVSAVLVCLFPLFAAFGFLPATKDLFQAWIRSAIWATVLQLVAYTILGLVLTMFDKLMSKVLLEGQGFVADTEMAVTVLGTAALLGGLGTAMIRMTPMITGLLGSANIHIGGIYPEKKFYGAANNALKRAGGGVAALGAAAMTRGGAAGARARASSAEARAQRIVGK